VSGSKQGAALRKRWQLVGLLCDANSPVSMLALGTFAIAVVALPFSLALPWVLIMSVALATFAAIFLALGLMLQLPQALSSKQLALTPGLRQQLLLLQVLALVIPLLLALSLTVLMASYGHRELNLAAVANWLFRLIAILTIVSSLLRWSRFTLGSSAGFFAWLYVPSFVIPKFIGMDLAGYLTSGWRQPVIGLLLVLYWWEYARAIMRYSVSTTLVLRSSFALSFTLPRWLLASGASPAAQLLAPTSMLSTSIYGLIAVQLLLHLKQVAGAGASNINHFVNFLLTIGVSWYVALWLGHCLYRNARLLWLKPLGSRRVLFAQIEKTLLRHLLLTSLLSVAALPLLESAILQDPLLLLLLGVTMYVGNVFSAYTISPSNPTSLSLESTTVVLWLAACFVPFAVTLFLQHSALRPWLQAQWPLWSLQHQYLLALNATLLVLLPFMRRQAQLTFERVDLLRLRTFVGADTSR
jgi:hypothetical protein